MRTTIDLPDALFRKTKALAALQGSSMKDFIVRAVQHETESIGAHKTKAKKSKNEPFEVREVAGLKFPLIRLKDGRKLDLTGFDFDDLLG